MSAYITVSELTEYLGIEAADDDFLLTELIEAASAKIESETGRVFVASADTTRYYDIDAIDGKRLFLDADLCAMTTVTNGDATVVAGSQFYTNPRNITPYYALELKPTATVGWDGLTGEISILGRWAYSTTPNDEIKFITKRLAGWYYRQRDNSSENDRTIVAGNATILPSRVPADVADALKVYKVRV